MLRKYKIGSEEQEIVTQVTTDCFKAGLGDLISDYVRLVTLPRRKKTYIVKCTIQEIKRVLNQTDIKW